ncbi:MAG TPA: DUF2066 domain-containing protein [Gammaproteobacteria bacterium]|nr:DUF2066 domain-containing protein [Gammaproteobacteria bacterium]
MKRLGLLSIACLLFASWLAPAHAVIVSGLYEARVPVTDQSTAARTSAVQQAFGVVLVKVTGDRAAAGALASALGNPNQYLQQYRYEKVDADPADNVPAGLMLWTKFGASVIAKALTANHAPLWGNERPRTLIWLVSPDAGGHILTAAENTPVMQALLTAAQQRGIVLVFPQMDAQDKAAIGVPDLSGFNAERIRAASARYQPDAVLVGIMTPAEGQLAGRWEWLAPDKVEGWQTPAGDATLVAVDGVQVAADRFAARYAIAADAHDQSGIPLQVDGVTSLDAYAKVSDYLKALTPVRSVRVDRVAQGSVFYNLDIHGSLDNLASALVFGGLLSDAATTAPVGGSAAGNLAAAVPAPLHYSYKP